MASKVQFGDLTTATFGGASQLDYIKGARYTLKGQTDEAAALTTQGARAEVVKRSGALSFDLFSNQRGTQRISNLDITSVSIDGTEYETMAKGGSFRLTVPNKDASAAQDLWAWPQPLPNSRDFSASVDLMIVAGSATANALRDFGVQLASADENDSSMVLTLVIDTTTITLPMTVENLELGIERDGLQMIKLDLKGRAPISGTYPTSPAGTTTLLEKAINAAATALAFTFTPHDDVGFGQIVTGNMVVESVDFSFNDGQIVVMNYQYAVQGQPTATNT